MADDRGIAPDEEINELPRWARLAFAARSARRVQPLFKASWPQAPDKHIIALDNAITLAERSAADADDDAYAADYYGVTAASYAADFYAATAASYAAAEAAETEAEAAYAAAHAAAFAAYAYA